MSYDFWIIAYRIALGALVLGLMLRGTGPMKRTIITILAVYVVGYVGGIWLWPSEWWAGLMMAVDTIACIVVTIRPAGKWQSVIGLSFIFQIAVHAGRIFNGAEADINAYWTGLSILAFMQLFLAGGWLAHDRGYLSWIDRRNDRAAAAAAREKGVEW